jgi:hypothetical protein
MIPYQLTRCASLVGEQLRKTQRREPEPLAQVHAYGVTQDLPEETGREVSRVPRPHPLGPVALHQLAYHRLYAPPGALVSHLGQGCLWRLLGVFFGTISETP